MSYFEPLGAPQGALYGDPAARGCGRDRRWTRRSHKPRPRPGRGRKGPRRPFANSRPRRFGDRRAPCGRRRRCRSPCRSSMMSNRPAEHSDGDRSTRNAAHGPENMRFRANSRRSGAETTSRTPISHPGAPPTPSPARHTCSTPSSTSSPSPATTTTPRSAPSGTAFRRPADIREANAHPRKLRGNAAVRRWERRRVKSAGVGAGGIASARSAAERRQNTPRRDE